MTDKQITLSLPEALWEQVQAAHIDVQGVAIAAFEKALSRTNHAQAILDIFARMDATPDDLKPTEPEIDEAVQRVRSKMYAQRKNSSNMIPP